MKNVQPANLTGSEWNSRSGNASGVHLNNDNCLDGRMIEDRRRELSEFSPHFACHLNRIFVVPINDRQLDNSLRNYVADKHADD